MCTERGTDVADLSSTYLVHDAVRRDMSRFAAAIDDLASESPARAAERAAALAEHWRFVVTVVRRRTEVHGAMLWPLLRSRAPEIGVLVDRLEDDLLGFELLLMHTASRLDALARDPGSERARRDARRAVVSSAQVVSGLLDVEERYALALVPQVLDRDEWLAVEEAQQRALGPRQVARLVPWLLDGGHRARLLWGNPH